MTAAFGSPRDCHRQGLDLFDVSSEYRTKVDGLQLQGGRLYTNIGENFIAQQWSVA